MKRKIIATAIISLTINSAISQECDNGSIELNDITTISGVSKTKKCINPDEKSDKNDKSFIATSGSKKNRFHKIKKIENEKTQQEKNNLVGARYRQKSTKQYHLDTIKNRPVSARHKTKKIILKKTDTLAIKPVSARHR